ncbi:GTP-binding protein, putative [Eimeria maxima]|uniref:GTP-binding protein, putative n=1 Tax=Eimeria maxima TaxID=5804 RepID=U6LZT6_EIMMA|nr:GTP-binding protein, putative [Eimeria maxima]CDJ56363.1 GTP-binding protein, putative [Eimeria maxima]
MQRQAAAPLQRLLLLQPRRQLVFPISGAAAAVAPAAPVPASAHQCVAARWTSSNISFTGSNSYSRICCCSYSSSCLSTGDLRPPKLQRQQPPQSSLAAAAPAPAATEAATAADPEAGVAANGAYEGFSLAEAEITAEAAAAATEGPSAQAPAAAAAAEPPAAAAAKSLISLLHEEDLEFGGRPPPPFCDFLWVEAKGGRGGSPKPGSFRSRALGKGPGYGGHGGSVLLRCSSSIDSLFPLQQQIAAAPGGDGHKTSRGLHAPDTIVKLPPGTIVRKRILTGEKSKGGRSIRTSVFWQQLLEEGQSLLVAAGGRGGIAPPNIKQQKKRRAPEFRVCLMKAGEKVFLELELRLVNDIGVVGENAAGKTSLVSALTDYQSRIGPQGFQTRRPFLASIGWSNGHKAVVLDAPALFPGAHKDKRLGLRILRHYCRSRVYLYVLDPTQTEQQQDPRLLLLLQQQQRQQSLLQQQERALLDQQQREKRSNSNEADILSQQEQWLEAQQQGQHEQQKHHEQQQERKEQQQQEQQQEQQKQEQQWEQQKEQQKQQLHQQQQQQQEEMEETRLLQVYGELAPDVFCQFLRLRRELRLHDKHFHRKTELVVVTKCDALERQPLLAVDSLHHRMRHFFPDIPVIAASPRFGLGCAAVANELYRLLELQRQQQQQLVPLRRVTVNLEETALALNRKP